MIKYTFEINPAYFYKHMNALAAKVIPYVKITVEQVAEKAVSFVAAHTPPTRTGRTKIRDLWKLRHQRRGTIERYFIENTYHNPDILIFMDEGTSPHTIRPKDKKMLHWIDEETKEHIFAKIVHHPGTPAYRMIEKAERECNALLDWYIKQTFKMVDNIMKG